MFFSRQVKRRRKGKVHARKTTFEKFESRDLLAVAPPTLGFAPSVFLPSTTQEQSIANKVGYELAHLWSDWNGYQALGGPQGVGMSLGAYSDAAQSKSYQLDGNRVFVTAYFQPSSAVASFTDSLMALGMTAPIYDGVVGVTGSIPIDAIDELANVDGLNFARVAFPALTNSGSTGTFLGDRAQGTETLRLRFPTTGAGTKVGVISNSYDTAYLNGPVGTRAAQDVISGDLPSGVSVLSDTIPVALATDEGRAMLQIVHDIAPGASLAFQTYGTSQASLRSAILNLQANGAKVIVDDALFPDEPMFQDGIVAQAIDQVVSQGVIYVAAAGNKGNRSYEAAFNPGPAITVNGSPETTHLFGAGGVNLQTITIPNGATFQISFQWDSPFASAGGSGSTNDLNVYLLNSSTGNTVAFSRDPNVGANAVEVLTFLNNTSTTGTTQFFLLITKASGANPGTIKYVDFSRANSLGQEVVFDNFMTGSSTLFGHPDSTGAIAVGATKYDNTNSFGVVPPVIETTSARGGTPILFNNSGTRLAAPAIRQKTDIVGPDGDNTTFFGVPDPVLTGPYERDGFPNFFGTSAAAAHIAGLAALQLQIRPTLTPAETVDALKITAIDMDDPGLAGYPDGFDYVTGNGFVNGLDAGYHVYTPLLPQLAQASDSGVVGDRRTNVLQPVFTGTVPPGSSVWLYVDGAIRGSQHLLSPTTTYSILCNAPLTPGVHNVQIRVGSNSGTTEVKRSNPSAPWNYTIDRAGPTVGFVAFSGSSWTNQSTSVRYSYATLVSNGKQLAPDYMTNTDRIHVKFTENVIIPPNPATALTILGNNQLPISQTITYDGYEALTGTATWKLSSPLAAGKYQLRVSGIKDEADNGFDGYWVSYDGLDASTHTPDDFSDDKHQNFPSGNGGLGTIFTFNFSMLPGDYNQDGIVNSSDAAAGTVKDGNGDGLVDSNDTAIATMNNLTQLSLRPAGGDYADDDIVNTLDYQIWRGTFGSNYDLRADGNGNGVIDAADYILWRNAISMSSAWYPSTNGSAAGFAVVDFGNAPSVVNVTISGSNSAHDPYSFDGHDGSGEQLRTVPVGGADTISITFSEDVNVVAENLRVFGLRTFNLPTVVEFAYDMATMTATWRFDDLVANDHYLISLSDAVTDIEGNRLDGEWVNPISVATSNVAVGEFPSGNGAAGGNFNFVATILAADANRDNIITDEDLDIWDAYFAQDGTYTEGDFAGDGIVGWEDYPLWDYYWGVDRRTVAVWGDVNGDYAVDDADLDILASNLGMSNPTHNDGDLNGDGLINTSDLDLMFAQYGVQLSLAS